MRDINVFLDFENFYSSIIRNFNRIVVLLTLMFQTTNENKLDIQASRKKKNQNIPDGINSGNDRKISRCIKFLSIIAN